MYHDPLDQSTSPASSSHSLDSQVVGPNCDQVQSSHNTQVEEHQGEDSSNISSLFQNLPCQNNEFPFLNDSQSTNLSGKANTINSFNKPPTLGIDHSNDDDSIDVCHDEFPSTSYDLSISHEYFNLDLESGYVKEYFHIETSFSPHYPLCPIVCNKYTCDRDNPCSLVSSSNELSPQLTQGSEVVHGEIENSQIIEYPSHSSSSLILHEDNSSNHLSHEISPNHFSLNMLSEEPLQLSNLIVEVEKSGDTCDEDGCHRVRSFEIRNNSYPQTIHDLVQDSIRDSTILEILRPARESRHFNFC